MKRASLLGITAIQDMTPGIIEPHLVLIFEDEVAREDFKPWVMGEFP